MEEERRFVLKIKLLLYVILRQTVSSILICDLQIFLSPNIPLSTCLDNKFPDSHQYLNNYSQIRLCNILLPFC